MATGSVIWPRVVTVMSRIISCFIGIILHSYKARYKLAWRNRNQGFADAFESGSKECHLVSINSFQKIGIDSGAGADQFNLNVEQGFQVFLQTKPLVRD